LKKSSDTVIKYLGKGLKQLSKVGEELQKKTASTKQLVENNADRK
jgi:hypothetical protein